MVDRGFRGEKVQEGNLTTYIHFIIEGLVGKWEFHVLKTNDFDTHIRDPSLTITTNDFDRKFPNRDRRGEER